MIKYGYFEAKIQEMVLYLLREMGHWHSCDHSLGSFYKKIKNKVPSDRRGRACKMKLVPSSDSSVLGDRIDIMNNAVSANNQFKTNVAYLDGNTEARFQILDSKTADDWLLSAILATLF